MKGNNLNYNRPWIFITAFIAGFVLMGYEIFGSRVLQPYFGSGIHIWGALIAVFMAGLSVGYLVGGKIADKFSGVKTLTCLLMIPGTLLLLFPIYGKAFCIFADGLNRDERLETLIASLLLFFVPSLCIGMISPYLVKMNTNSLEKVGSGNGTVFAIATTGSILGTLASAFYLIGKIESPKAIALFGLVLLCSSIGSLFFQGKVDIVKNDSEN